MSEPFLIVHATDLRPGGGSAFAHALALARDTRASLVTLHASVDGAAPRPMPEAATQLRQWGQEPVVQHSAVRHTCCDDPVDTLLDYLHREPADLLVLATRQVGGLRRLLHDSVSEAVARNADLPTLFVPFEGSGFVGQETGAVGLSTVLIPAASAAEAHTALALLGRLVDRAEWPPLEVVVLHIGPGAAPELELLPQTDKLLVRSFHRDGKVVEAIAETAIAVEADLVVMPTRGHDGMWDILAGSTTEQTLHTITCPLLAIPVQD